MKAYNGFTPAQRLKAYQWLQAEYEAGRRVRPIRCDACSQTSGVIEAHSEDYSRPFGAHIGQHGLCWTCHMMVHNRLNAPDAWRRYRASLRAGAVFRPFYSRDFGAFSAAFLRDDLPGPDHYREATTSTVLDDIDAAGG